METNPIIEIKDLTKVYGSGEIEVRALDGVSMSIQPGELMAIMGPSGSGKSTLMNILGCLDRPTDGEYILDGVDVSGLRRYDSAIIRNQKIGFVFQSYNLLSRADALENVMMPMMYNREKVISGRERRERAMQALEAVGLADRTHHIPSKLSGGQQQRVAIARALVNNPKIILADEPTGNLDTQSAIEIMKLIQDLNDEGRTIILVTHEDEVAIHAKRVIFLRDGKIESDRSNGELRRRIESKESRHEPV